MKLSELLYENEYILSEIAPDTEIARLTTLLEEADDHTILIIPNSKRLDLPEHLNKAPAAVVCDTNAILPDNFPAIRVVNPRLTMANLYYRFEQINLSNIKTIGITGTNGKTSTAFFTKSILAHAGYKVGFIGTGKIEINGIAIEQKYYSMTTPDPPLLYKYIKMMQQNGCDVIVMEVSSHSLALDKVAPIRFDYGIFTNLSPEHLDFHKSENEYFLAKRRLIEKCDKAIINADDAYGKRLYDEFSHKSISAGILHHGDVWTEAIDNKGLDGLSYMYNFNNLSYEIALSTPGIYNVYNSMLASCVCNDIGIKPCDVKDALSGIPSLPGRFEIIRDDVTVVIDYAHTHVAFYNIMKELSQLKGQDRLCVIFGCGGQRDKGKRPKMAEIAEKYADRIIVTTDNSRNEDPGDIISDIIKGFHTKNYEIDEDRSRAIKRAILTSKKNDVIAVIGKGCESYNIDRNGYSDFNEKEIIKSALEERRHMN